MHVGGIRTRLRAAVTAAAIVLPLFAVTTAASPTIALAASNRLVSASGTAGFGSPSSASDINGIDSPEIRVQNAEPARGTSGPNVVDGSGSAAGTGSGGGTPVLGTSFDGLNHRDQRLANSGHQFSLEPPDQGLCAGNGFVLETVNDVMKVFDYSGNTLKATTDLNSFYGFAPAIIRGTKPEFGPFVTDPSCFFDKDTQRWFHLVLTLDTNPKTGAFVGKDHLDLAVSRTADPTGLWNVYKFDVEDDGTKDQPNHHCSGSPATPPSPRYGPCFGDYPHLGADAYGLFMTTNEYSFFGNEFHGAQVYAASKRELAAGAKVALVQFDTNGADNGKNGFTIAPATTPGGDYQDGTEYFLSSNSASEVFDTGDGLSVASPSSEILAWSLSGTETLDTDSPGLQLTHRNIAVGTYDAPPPSDQKIGNTPLKDCLNNTACATRVLGGPDTSAPETEVALDSSDTRMLQTTYVNGQLWGALDTALNGKAGIEYFIVQANSGQVVKTAYLGLAGNNLTYPAIGVTPSGRGVVAFTVLGPDHFPSAGYAGLDNEEGAGPVKIIIEGAGPDDGFSGYKVFGNRTRWGDYGATAVVGDSIWMASEYIGQTCSFAEYNTPTTFGSCGGTRTVLANWDTRISVVTP